MNTNEVISNAIVSFGAGLAAGYRYHKHNSLLEKRDFYAEFEKERVEEEMQKAGITQETFSKWRKVQSTLNNSTPYFYATFFSLANSIVHLDLKKFGETSLVAIPSAYMGYLTGITAHKIGNIKLRKELKIAREIDTNPDSIEKYLSKEDADSFRTILGKLEREFLEGNLDSEKLKPRTKEIYDLLFNEDKLYSKIMLRSSLKRIDTTLRFAHLQREAKEFYESKETNNGVTIKNLDELDIQKPTIVFIKQGEKFYCIDFKWDNINILENDDEKSVQIDLTPPKTKILLEEDWSPDYKRIGGIIQEKGQDGNRLLMKCEEKTPTILQKILVTQSFFNRYISKAFKEKT